MNVFVLQKIDYVSGTSGVVCVYADFIECLKFLKKAGWKMTNTPNMYTQDSMHCHVIIHEKPLIEAGPNQHLLTD